MAESNGVTWVGTDGDGLLRVRPRLITSYLVQDGERDGNAFVDSYVAQNGCPAMTTDEAIAYLASLQGGAGNAGSEEQPQEAPADGSGVVISF